jgi:hypothetical protein
VQDYLCAVRGGTVALSEAHTLCMHPSLSISEGALIAQGCVFVDTDKTGGSIVERREICKDN